MKGFFFSQFELLLMSCKKNYMFYVISKESFLSKRFIVARLFSTFFLKLLFYLFYDFRFLFHRSVKYCIYMKPDI